MSEQDIHRVWAEWLRENHEANEPHPDDSPLVRDVKDLLRIPLVPPSAEVLQFARKPGQRSLDPAKVPDEVHEHFGLSHRRGWGRRRQQFLDLLFERSHVGDLLTLARRVKRAAA